jgi:hypothetical protein
MSRQAEAGALVAVEGLNETLRVLRSLPKEAQAEIRDAAGKIAALQAARISAGAGHSAQSKHVAASIRVRRDRIPSIAIGGNAKAPVARHSGRQLPTMGQLLFGSEFGAANNWRFPPSSDSYWLFQGLKAVHPVVVATWAASVDQIANKWSVT